MRRRNKKFYLPPFVPLTWKILNNQAYKDITFAAAKALPYFLGKVKKSYGDYTRYLEEFHFSYKEARSYGFATGTFANVINSLIEKGFIDPVDKGGLKCFGKGCNKFRLSKRWENYGTKDFQKVNWKNFSADE